MKRLLLLFLALVSLSLSPSTESAKWDRATRSVRRLVAEFPEQPSFICTTFLINPKEKVWLTAGHCVGEILEGKDDAHPDTIIWYPLSIDDDPANVVVADLILDLAVLRTSTIRSVAPLPLSPDEPQAGAPVAIVGFPYGHPVPYIKPVMILNPRVENTVAPEEWPFFTALDGKGAPGMSGSPLVNAQGQVVGIYLGWWQTAYGPIGSAVPWQELTRLAGAYFPM